MAEHPNIFLKKTFVAITGASRGLGRCMALQFSVKFPPNSVMVLMARNIHSLESVKSEVKSLAPDINVLVRQYDQGNVENKDYFKTIFDEILLENYLSQNDFDQYMIVHNCAIIYAESKGSLELSDPTSVRKYFDINLVGMILLNTSFFQAFSDATKSRLVVNMTSGLTSIPLPTVHLYSAAKAARDMYMRVLAVEEPSLRILTFAPGIADTDMIKQGENSEAGRTAATIVTKWRADGKIKHPDIPISKLVKILEENTFENAVYIESESLF